MTWYSGMCGIMAISLLYELAYSQCVYVCVGGGGALDPMIS
jgi:hypothetical protein